jgi:hypothetical protein
MWRGCNPIPEEIKADRHGRENHLLPLYQKFQSLYAEAITQTPSKNVVFGLEIDYSDTDQGLGGFYDAGYVPVDLFYRLDEKDWEKDFRFYWPRDPFSPDGKYMRYLGSVNLGVWPRVLHDMTSTYEKYWENGKSFACGTDVSRDSFRNLFEQEIWLHLFSSVQNEFDSAIPDCHVRMTTEFNFSKMDETSRKIVNDVYGNKHWTPEQIKEKIIAWQNEHTEKSEMIVTPKKFFANIRPRFYYDGPYPYSKKLQKLHEGGKNGLGEGLMTWHEGDCHVYGPPSSQQEARRYISPDSFNGVRACVPIFCFNDDDHDMTHQFYVDAIMMDAISHKRAYCKLDSSCT